jgi:microcin C transport system substrate-binding protein
MPPVPHGSHGLSRRSALRTTAATAAALLSGCSRSRRLLDYPKQRIPLPPEAMSMFQRYPDFFRFSSPDQLPSDLVWNDGADVPELGDPAATKGGTYFYSIPDFPRTLRFLGPDASGAFRSYILDSNALALAAQHPDTFQWFPQLATHWAFGADGRTVYFRLDPDARFSDGVPVRADDYLFCFYFMRCDYTADLWYQDFYTNKYSSITRFDDLTIAITLPEKKPDLLYRAISVRPVPIHFYQDLADDWVSHYQWQFEPTTGAYEVRPENIDKGRSITLSRVPDWWASQRRHHRYRYNVDRISVRVVRDQGKAFELFRKGEIDIFSMRLADYWYRKLPDSDERVTSGCIHKATFCNEIPRPTWAVLINRSRPLLDNRDIRQGIQFALNWELALREMFRGDAERMQTPCDGYSQVQFPGISARPFSTKEAEACFARAGFTSRGNDGVLVNDKGQRLSFTLTTGYKPYTDLFVILKNEALKAGLGLNLEIIEMTAAWKKMDEKKHDLAFGAKNVSVEMYPRFWENFHGVNAYKEDGSIKTDTNNETQTSIPELDALISAYDKAETMEEIVRLAREIVAILHEDAAFIPAFVQPYYRVAHWRWLRWPEGFNVRSSRDWEEFHLFWVDAAMKEETRRALASGSAAFPPSVRSFEQFRRPPATP